MNKLLGLFLLTSHAWAAGSREYRVCGQRMKLEEARSPAERERGLMGRTDLPAGTGMLFVFERDEVASFWMKNVPFDIDIGFFDRRGHLVNSTTMRGSSPLQRIDSLPRYSSAAPVRYAVEVPAKFFAHRKNCKLQPLPE